MQATTLGLDIMVRPRRKRWRSGWGLTLHLLTMTMVFGLFLAVSGSTFVAAGLTTALMMVFVIASNAKQAMLGEALIFSDLALFAALVRHPGFYFTALSAFQKTAFAVAGVGLLLTLARLFVPSAAPHLWGLALFGCAGAMLSCLLRVGLQAGLARIPAADEDLARHGLIATLLLYWQRWRQSADPPVVVEALAAHAKAPQPDIIVVVQCESFADPVALTGDAGLSLPGLARARACAWQWGDLAVSGFGAYTMRTEYGLLFGRSEEALGFRRYDPFLTARGEASYALSARLGAAGYRSLFVHPHDLRFYNRDRLMPAIGFDRLIGEDSFPPVVPGQGRYVDDRTVGSALRMLIDGATEPTFLYAVTMENHGPWMKGRLTGSPGGLDAYLHHVRNSDAMLTDLIDHLADAGRSALLIFFGDHRPSIPGVIEPGPIRHTPYVMLRFDADGVLIADSGHRIDLSPDQLHHAILSVSEIQSIMVSPGAD